MSDYIGITIHCQSAEQRDLLIAQLSNIGFEGFEEQEAILKAFIPESEFNEDLLRSTMEQQTLLYTVSVIKQENWNQIWESGFDPVIIDDFCAIRAAFHAAVSHVQHEIVITPKMSFGTGHHATTYMMIAAMRQVEWEGKSVFDFGTGTGVLAILAAKSGAGGVIAIDNDDWSMENARENLQMNGCQKIHLHKADGLPPGERFDVILANINKNVILQSLSSIADQLSADGICIMSGLLADDANEVADAAYRLKLYRSGLQERNGWICMQFVHASRNS